MVDCASRPLRALLLGLAAVLALVTKIPSAEAFSSFKGRFGGQHPICSLEPGTQIWPEQDISVAAPRAVSNVTCPSTTRVNECKNVRQGQSDYAACQAVLSLDRQCRKPPQANLGNRGDKQYWAGYSSYKYVQRRSYEDLGRLGEIEVPVDIHVRVHVVTEADPYYSFVYPAFTIGSQHIQTPPVRVQTLRTGWNAYDPRHYWGGWYEDCLCHNPHRYTRGPINYWFGDTLTPRAAAPMKLTAGTHEIRGKWKCPNRGGDECRSQRVYQQRLRIEFLACD